MIWNPTARELCEALWALTQEVVSRLRQSFRANQNTTLITKVRVEPHKQEFATEAIESSKRGDSLPRKRFQCGHVFFIRIACGHLISEWVRQNRVLPKGTTARPGAFRAEKLQIEMMDVVVDPNVHQIG